MTKITKVYLYSLLDPECPICDCKDSSHSLAIGRVSFTWEINFLLSEGVKEGQNVLTLAVS